MIIMKFGGSSVANADRIRHVTEIVKQNLDKKPVVVVSAMGTTTDNLLDTVSKALSGNISISEIEKLHRDTAAELGIIVPELDELLNELNKLLCGISLIREFSPRTKDYLVSFGERLSARVVAAHLTNAGIYARHYDSWELGITTNSEFTNADILDETYDSIKKSLANLKGDYTHTPVITGFIGKDKEGNITTFGRGGSDLTAAILGAALETDEIQVWKDVDGMLTTDPRVVKQAQPVKQISFEEASELAYFGAKVLHPRSILPAMNKNIPVRVKNSYNPTHPGTMILRGFNDEKEFVRVLTYKKHVTLIDIVSTRMLGQYGFLAKVFQIFDENRVSVDMLATSEVSISLTLDNRTTCLDRLRTELEKIATVHIKQNKTIITLVGNVKRSTQILEKTFDVLQEQDINVQMISQGASKVNISFIIDDDEAEASIRALHKAFFE
ncbi:MAG: aspartate kinase [Candidatus Rifleibacteriota bacterium]